MNKSELKIVLCTVPQSELDDRSSGELPWTPNVAIVSLMKWMEKNGFASDYFGIDMLLSTDKEICDYFSSKKPDVVGLSAVVSTSYLKVKKITSLIKKSSPSTIVVVGGNMAASANALLTKANIDVCVLGDGEIAWVNLLNHILENDKHLNPKELVKIKGFAFMNEGEMEFTGYGDPLPAEENCFPDYDILSKGLMTKKHLISNYFREGKRISWFNHDNRAFDPDRKPNCAIIWTNKGCISRCTFCQRFIKGYQLYNLKKLDEHLSELKEKFNVGFIQIGGENFGLPKDYAYKVAELMKKHDMLWFAGGVRCDSFTYDDMKYFKDCGCTGLKFGVESGSNKILDIMEKKFTADDVFKALTNAKKLGIFSPVAFCIGMPGETNDTIIETGKFIGRVAKLVGKLPTAMGVAIFRALPLPGAPLYEYGRLKGVIGNSAEEEEAFLEYLANKGTDAQSYINLNGSNTKDIIFWSYLIFFEAFGEYYSGQVSKPVDVPKKTKLDIRHPFNNILWSMMGNRTTWMILSRRIPRHVIYQIFKNIIYIRFSALEILRRIERWALKIYHKEERKVFLKKTSLSKCEQYKGEVESLRKINQKIKARTKAPSTKTEINQRILYEGR